MRHREVEMWEILSILERVGRGESQAAVSRATGQDRKTIRRYLAITGRCWSGTNPCLECWP